MLAVRIVTIPARRFHVLPAQTGERVAPGDMRESAGRMNISPNTVMAFIRMVMGKLGVSTRSGIVGIVFRGIYTASYLRPFALANGSTRVPLAGAGNKGKMRHGKKRVWLPRGYANYRKSSGKSPFRVATPSRTPQWCSHQEEPEVTS